MRTLSRRSLLKRLAALAAAPGLAAWAAACGRWREADGDLLAAAVDLGEGARQLGKHAVEAGGVPADLAELFAPLRPDVQRSKGDAQVLGRALAARVRKDFETGQIATVEGWHLSDTEVRLCAIAFLRGPTGEL